MATSAGNVHLRTPENIKDFLALTAAAGEHGTPCHQAPEAWFSFDKETQRETAKRCNNCPLIMGCREFALSSKQAEGVWGGLTSDERKDILATRKREQRAEWARLRAARAAAATPTLDDSIFGALAS